MRDITIIESHELYQVGLADMVGQHADRRLAVRINHGGEVHLNMLNPGAKAGNHYHKELIEFFANTAPYPLRLHLRHQSRTEVVVVDMLPATTSEVRLYRPYQGVPHIVENPGSQVAVLVIIVDEDQPEDIWPASVYSV